MDHPHPEALLAHDHFVRALSRRLLGDAHDAEDAVQQTWLAALEHPSQSGAPLRAWLANVLRNFVRRGHRSAERRLARELRAARPSGVPSPSEIAEREAARRSVLAAVLALAEPFRDAILLRFYDNCKPHAAARQLGIPVETFRTRVKRGLELLRCELEREYGSTRRWSMALLPLAAVPPATPEPRMISSLLEEGAPAMNIVPKLAVVLLAAGIMSGLWHLLPRPAPNHADPPPRANQAQQPNAALAGGPPAARAVVEAAPAPLPSSAGRKEPVGGGDTGAVAVQALFDDGSPAYPLGIELVEWATPQYSLHKRYAPTDASGACRFEGVAAGRVHVMYDRSPGGDGVDVVAGAEARVALRLPRFAWSVRGEVVDAGGQPVPGAEIWFAGCDRQGQVITTADALGRFEIRHVERISFLAARAPGREPSPAACLYTLARDPAQPIPLRLTIGGAASRLEGRVLAPGGGAIGGAVVLIGSEDDHDADGSLPHPRLRLLADDQGRFTTDAVRPGTTVVRAGADGWAVSATNVVIAPGATTTIDVVLANGATIRGHVTSAGGAPAPDVSIHSGDAQLEAFDALHTTSGAAGEFTLAHVPAGRATVTARSLGNRSATTTLQVADGEIAEWNPVLPDGASIGGRALDEHDVPLANHTIVACHDATGAMSCVRSGADGGFTLRDLAAGNHLVAVYPPGGRIGGEPLAYVAGVNAGSTDVLLRVTDATRPSARVRGTVLTPDDGVPSGRSAQALVPRPFGIVTAVADIDRDRGTFELGPLPPGSYQLKACVDGFREQTLCDFTLTKDQLLDLGDLFLRAQ